MAEPVFWLSFLVVAIPTLALLVAQVRASRRAFEIAASLLGLPPTAVSGTVFVRIKGLVRGFSVVGRQQSFGDRDSTTTIEVAGTGLIPPELLLAREGMGTSFGSLLAGKGISTGDERFDNTILIRGQPTLTLALLDHETRCRSADLVRKGGKLAGGTISLTVRGRLSDGGDLAGRVRTMLDLAERLSRREPAVERLAANVRNDPVTGVRHRNMQELISTFPEHPLTRATLKFALDDRGPEVRLLAAVALGLDGLDCLRAIVEDTATPEMVALEAVDSLGEHLPTSTALARLEAAVLACQSRLANALVGRLAASNQPEALQRLAEHLARGLPSLAAGCARALGQSGSATIEPALVAALSNPSADVRTAAAEALGTVGSVGSVAALRATANSTLLAPGVRAAALEAIARIQGRLVGAASGQLGLSDSEAGELSLATGRDGDLSLTEDGPRPEIES